MSHKHGVACVHASSTLLSPTNSYFYFHTLHFILHPDMDSIEYTLAYTTIFFPCHNPHNSNIALYSHIFHFILYSHVFHNSEVTEPHNDPRMTPFLLVN